ncbi:MAG: hypothetical protein DMG92_18305 [Acidobacteria bacterium]|nr:MAG: hypothetical protein DMG92_18305 [Acidobacteriota bacterium]
MLARTVEPKHACVTYENPLVDHPGVLWAQHLRNRNKIIPRFAELIWATSSFTLQEDEQSISTVCLQRVKQVADIAVLAREHRTQDR